jgi:hypothetical protein
MNEVIAYLMGYGIPIIVLITALIVVVVGIGLSASIPRILVIIFLFMIFVVPQASNYGTADGDIGKFSILWVKGSKSFVFPFVEMLLVSVWFFGVFIARHWDKYAKEFANPLSKWYMAFGLMFTGHIIFAILDKQSLIQQLASTGVVNIVKQGMFVAILFATVRTERDIDLLFKFILVCLAANEFWGLFRYAFLGGDPQNIYATAYSELRGLKITFFDGNEHILASLMLGICAWKVLAEKVKGWDKVAYILMGGMAILVPMLSARRTAQMAVVLSLFLLFLLLPKGRRFPIIIVLALSIPIGLASLFTRTADSHKSFSEKILMDVKVGEEAKDPKASRFYELDLALRTVKEKPIFGVGPSGEFKVENINDLSYHHGYFGFVHSGFVHVLLKTGIVGFIIFMGIYVTFIVNVFKGYRYVLPQHKALVVGCLCGFVALYPSLQGGTPIIEIRTMMVAGFFFAIPLICIAIGRKFGVKNKDSAIESNELLYFSPTLPMRKLRENK